MRDREIKFRGKRLYNDEWVYGYYLVASGMTFISVFGVKEPIIIISETAGQLVGMQDVNGKEIYTGDIVEIKTSKQYGRLPKGAIGQVYFDTKELCYKVGIGQFRLTSDKKVEVIGNIHDNPELLKKIR